MAFKMKGSPMHRNFGISPAKQRDEKRENEVIKKNTNQTTDRETNVAVRAQNRDRISNLSRSDVQKELKEQKKQGLNTTKGNDTSFIGRVFKGTKRLKKDLLAQQQSSLYGTPGHVKDKKNN